MINPNIQWLAHTSRKSIQEVEKLWRQAKKHCRIEQKQFPVDAWKMLAALINMEWRDEVMGEQVAIISCGLISTNIVKPGAPEKIITLPTCLLIHPL